MENRSFNLHHYLKTAHSLELTDLRQIFKIGIAYKNIKKSLLTEMSNEALQLKKMLLMHLANKQKYLYVRFELMSQQPIEKLIEVTEDYEKTINTLFATTGQQRVFLRVNEKNLAWEQFSMQYLYEKNTKDNMNVHKDYEKLHTQIIEGIRNILPEQSQGLRVHLIDGGCGTGLLLKKIESQLRDANFELKFLGFDFNKSNISDCYNNYQNKIKFIEGNLNDTHQIIHAYLKENKKDASDITILLLSGALTRLVLDGGMTEALKIIQEIAQQKEVDYVMGGGVGEPLITPHIAKMNGFKLNYHFNAPYKPGQYFCYKKMTRDELLQQIQTKVDKENILDLSFSYGYGDLLSDITCGEHTLIDLSFCHYSKNLEDKLKNHLQKYPKNKIVFQHTDPDAIQSFAKSFLAKFEVLNLKHVHSSEQNNDIATSEYAYFNLERKKIRTNGLRFEFFANTLAPMTSLIKMYQGDTFTGKIYFACAAFAQEHQVTIDYFNDPKKIISEKWYDLYVRKYQTELQKDTHFSIEINNKNKLCIYGETQDVCGFERIKNKIKTINIALINALKIQITEEKNIGALQLLLYFCEGPALCYPLLTTDEESILYPLNQGCEGYANQVLEEMISQPTYQALMQTFQIKEDNKLLAIEDDKSPTLNQKI